MNSAETKEHYVRLHTRLGWSQVLLFLLLGIVLEAMHGFKLGWYLDAGEETRRLLLTLAHSHGVLLGVVNIVLAGTWQTMPKMDSREGRIASPLLITGCIMLPAGFLLGGLVTYGGDPGLGVFLVAPGALFLAIAIGLITRAVFRS